MTNPALAAPIPVPDPDSAPYWEGLKSGKLMLCRCDDTGKWIHPPLERSRYTGGPVHFEEVSGDGTIFSYIVVRQALVPGRVPPYVVGLVELAEQPGLRINAVIDADPADVRIGQAGAAAHRRSRGKRLPHTRIRHQVGWAVISSTTCRCPGRNRPRRSGQAPRRRPRPNTSGRVRSPTCRSPRPGSGDTRSTSPRGRVPR